MSKELDNKESTLLLDYIFDDKEASFNKILIENKEYLIESLNKKKIKINFNEIENELGSKILNISLINQYIKDDHHYCEIVPGTNHGILFPSLGYTIDIIFPENKTFKVKIISLIYKQTKEFNINGKRLLLINFSKDYLLYIDDILITNEVLKLPKKGESSQISVVDLQNRVFLFKDISPIQFDLFFKNYEKYKGEANYFFNEINDFIKKRKFNLSEYQKLFFNDELIKIILTKFNLPKKILMKEYNKKEYFEFIFSCSLYFIMCSLKNEEEIKSVYKYFMNYKMKLEKDSNLENYMRILIIIELSTLLKNRNIQTFEKLEFQYYNTNTLEKDSPLKSAITFLTDFILNIDEASPFIYPLILIDSGNYVYGKENAYGYGLTNIEILKSHLKNIIPDIIISFIDEEKKSDQAYSNKRLGSVKLNYASNFLSILKNYKIDKKVDDEEIRSKLGLILFLTLFHELFGHNKGGYSSKNDDICNSPNVFYDKKEKKILKLVNRNSFYLNANDVPILRDDDRLEDAGHFLEYFIGKCEYGFYSEIIEIMILNNINLNFIFDMEMWNKKIDIMRNYIRLKYIIFTYDKTLLDKKKYSKINDEIEMLQNVINEKKIDLNKITKLNDLKIDGKNEKLITYQNKDELLEFHSLPKSEYEKYKNYSFEELQKIAFSKETKEELREVLYDIIFSRIIKK